MMIHFPLFVSFSMIHLSQQISYVSVITKSRKKVVVMKKFFRVSGFILIVLLLVFSILCVKSYFESKKPVISEGYYKDFKSSAELELKYSVPGPYEISSYIFDIDDKSIDKIRVWYPSELEKESKKYPMIMVVNASNVQADKYEPFFAKLASWGFIVVGNDDGQTGTGESSAFTLDYVLNVGENNILYKKVDVDNVGILGYSQGGAGAIRAVTEFQNGSIYKAIFTGSAAYPYLAKNMGWEYDSAKISIPYFMTAGTGKSDYSGKNPETEFGGVCPFSTLVGIYNSISNDTEKVMARVVGAEHEDMLLRTDAYMTAWFLYQLQNDNEAAKIFVGSNAELLQNDNWQDVMIGEIKNDREK